MRLKCEYCGIEFEATRYRRCCDRTHSTYLALQAKGKDFWHEEEESLLEKLAGEKPIAEIIKAVQRLDRRMGWQAKTDTAIQVKMKRLGLSRRCTLDNFTPAELARILGIPRDRPESWVEKFGLPYRKVDGYKGAILLKDLRQWASVNPHRMAGCTEEGLQWLLGDELGSAIAALPIPTHGRPKPVTRDDGVEYSSIKAAARANYIHRSRIREAVIGGGKSAGYRWRSRVIQGDFKNSQ
jgi:hypothetical protein